MKIGIISTYPPYPCGIAEYTSFLVQELQKYANKIVIFANRDEPVNQELERKEINELKKVERFSDLTKKIARKIAERIKPTAHFMQEADSKKVFRVFSVREKKWDELTSKIEEEGKFDVIHVQHEYSIFGTTGEFEKALEEIKKQTEKLVITFHTVLSKENELAPIQKKLIETADSVIVHSDICYYELWKQKVELSKVRIVWHGTLINKKKASKKRIAKMLENENSNSENLKEKIEKSFLVVLPGFLRWDKGINLLEEICKEVEKNWPDTLFVVSGIPQAQGEELEMIRKEIEKVEQTFNNIIFVRNFLPRDKLLELLAGADAILLPYFEWPGHTGVSGALHLAIGSAKPIIASAVPRVAEYSMMFPYLTFTPGDVNSFLKVFSYLRKRWDEVSKKVRQELLKYAQKTSWENVAKLHVEIYNE